MKIKEFFLKKFPFIKSLFGHIIFFYSDDELFFIIITKFVCLKIHHSYFREQNYKENLKIELLI